MKYQIFMYLMDDGRPKSGLVVDGRHYDLGTVSEHLGHPELAGPSVDQLLEAWSQAHDRLSALAPAMVEAGDRLAHAELDEAAIRFASPILRPGAIYGAGANYRDHVVAMAKALNMKLDADPRASGAKPWHFLKAGRGCVGGHRGSVVYPEGSESLDWEAELAVIIGRNTRNVAIEDALDHVAGYACSNDLSARDIFVRHQVDAGSPFRYDWVGHKAFAGSCPLGPYLTPAAFVPSPETLGIRLWLNDELRQDSNTSNHIFNVAEQISFLSSRVELFPGDVILTGTPAGVGMESHTFLKRGDTMRVWIEGLGDLQTTVI